MLMLSLCACTEAPSPSPAPNPEASPPVAPAPAAPAARPSLHDRPPSDVTVLDRGEDRWRCEPGAGQHQLEVLRAEAGDCEREAAGCARFASLFDTICSGPSPAPNGASPAGHDVPVTIGDEPLRCRRNEVPFVCAVTCFHEIDGLTRVEAERRFLLHVDGLRDRYGAETDAMTQGVSSYPHRQHRWQRDGTALSTELAQDLCNERVARAGPTQLRTRYVGPTL
jgi:hypothetical protein